jgi:hypothetical protein
VAWWGVRTRRFLLLSTLLLLSGCTTLGPVGSFPDPPLGPVPPAIAKPVTCPKHVVDSRSGRDLPGSGLHMVPPAPSALVLCGGQSRVVVEGHPMERLVSILNHLKPLPKGAILDCAADLGPSFYLFFNYPNGEVLRVTVASTGCRLTENGRLTAFNGKGELATIRALLK